MQENLKALRKFVLLNFTRTPQISRNKKEKKKKRYNIKKKML